jgi:hypothetical protein
VKPSSAAAAPRGMRPSLQRTYISRQQSRSYPHKISPTYGRAPSAGDQQPSREKIFCSAAAGQRWRNRGSSADTTPTSMLRGSPSCLHFLVQIKLANDTAARTKQFETAILKMTEVVSSQSLLGARQIPLLSRPRRPKPPHRTDVLQTFLMKCRGAEAWIL